MSELYLWWNYSRGLCGEVTDAECGCVMVTTLIYSAIHLLSRIWTSKVMILAKLTLACALIQMYSCKDGGQPSHRVNFAHRKQVVMILTPHAAFHCFSHFHH